MKTRLPRVTGEEAPAPGSFTFQAMLSCDSGRPTEPGPIRAQSRAGREAKEQDAGSSAVAWHEQVPPENLTRRLNGNVIGI